MLIAAMCGLCLLYVTNIAQATDRESLIRQFDRLDQSLHGGLGYSLSGNEAAVLTWAQSYLLEAYLVMYEATGMRKYLVSFVLQAENVYNANDKFRGIPDYKGRIRIGWGTRSRSRNNENVVSMVGTGMITYPLVKFAELVRRAKDLEPYLVYADKYTKLAEEAVAEFDHVWLFDQATGEGYYRLEGDEPNRADPRAAMAFNGPLALGRTIIILSGLTGNREYLAKARGLALTFKKNLITKDDCNIWGYRPDLANSLILEDISHGAIDAEFALLAEQKGIVFDADDMARFANTLLNSYRDGAFAAYVDGSHSEAVKVSGLASVRWLDFSRFDRRVYSAVLEYFKKYELRSPREHPSVLLGIAKLIKYFDAGSGSDMTDQKP